MTIRDIVVAFGFEVDRNSEKQAESSIKGLKNMATKLLGSIAVVFSVSKLTSFAKDCVSAASDVQEMENKFDVVFDNIRDDVDQWAEDFADAVGRNKNTIKGYLADQQNLLVGFGMTREEGAKLSEEMTSLALDLASFANTDETVAVNAMTKAVMGESEAAKTLGAVLNDTTRAETMAAMGLSGTYNSLDQLTKMQVNYQTILRQSPDAIGDCVRSMDSYEARTRQLNSAISEFKEFIGGQLLPVFAVFIGWITQGVKVATSFAKAILLDKEENNQLLKVFERIHATVKKLQPAIDRMAQTLSNGMNKAAGFMRSVIDRLGGVENVLKIAAIAAGTFMAVLAVSKIMSFMKAVGGLTGIMSKLAKMFSLANRKVLAIIAVVVILALIIEDFIHFMMGNDSVIGTFFDKASIGTDNVRKTIINAWNKIKEFLLSVWDFIKQAAGIFVDTIKRFFEKHVESIRADFERVWGIIKTFLSGVWTFLSQLATTLFGNTEDNINASTQSTKDKLLAIWKAIFDALLAVWDTLYNVGSGIFNVMATVIETIFGWIQSFWNRWGTKILAWFKELWNSMGGVLSAFLVIMKGIANFLSSVFTGDWQGVWIAVKDICKAVWDMIVNIVTAAWETMKLIFRMALSAIQSVWEATWKGIQSFFADVLEWIEDKTGFSMDGVRAIVRNALEIMKVLFSTVFEDIKAIVSAAFTIIKAVVSTAMQILQGIIQVVTSAIYGDWSGVWEGIKKIVLAVWEYIKTIVTTAIHLVYTIISNVLNAIKSIVESIWTAIIILVQTGLSNVATVVITCLTAISSAWNTVWSAVFGFFQGIWNGISSFLSGIWSTITSIISNSINNAYFVIQLVLGAIRDFFSNSFSTIASTVREIFSNILSSISLTIGDIKDTIVNGIHTAVDFIKGLPAQAVQWGADFVGGLKEGILSGVQGIVDAVKGIGDKIKSFLHFSVPDEGPLTDYESWMPDFMGGLAAGMESSSNELLSVVAAISAQIKEPFIFAFQETEEIISASMNHIGESVKSGLERGVAFLQSMPSQTMQWGVDLIDGLRNGILSGVDSIGNAVKSIAEQIRSYLHFSVPDVGPLTDYESWMPDFMGGLAKGIGENETLVFDKIRSLASGIAMLTQAATASAATVANHTIQNTTSNLTQNVNISNSYSGGSMETQRNVSKAMKQSAVDATDYLARGLAYARG